MALRPCMYRNDHKMKNIFSVNYNFSECPLNAHGMFTVIHISGIVQWPFSEHSAPLNAVEWQANFSVIHNFLRSSVSNGRPYWFSTIFWVIIKVFRFQRKTLLLHVFYYFSYQYCTADLSKTVSSIFMKFVGLIVNYKIIMHFLWRHYRFWEIAIVLVFWGVCCPDFLSESIRDTKLKFSAKVDKVKLFFQFQLHSCGSKGPENERKLCFSTFWLDFFYFELFCR